MEAKVGDRIAVESERVGQPTREGKVLEVLPPGPAVHYRVRWARRSRDRFLPARGQRKRHREAIESALDLDLIVS